MSGADVLIRSSFHVTVFSDNPFQVCNCCLDIGLVSSVFKLQFISIKIRGAEFSCNSSQALDIIANYKL